MYIMSRIIIKHVGPIKEVDIDLKKVNVFIGPQSSGKSTIAKIVSFCTWVEKNRHEMTYEIFLKSAISEMESFHRMKGYFGSDSKIFYQGDNIAFAYNYVQGEPIPIDFQDGTYNEECSVDKEVYFHRIDRTINPKVCYMPAERNFVSVVPNLQKYDDERSNLQSYVVDWFNAKRHYSKSNPLPILNLGISYFSESDIDYLVLPDGRNVLLSNASSGMQSLTPLVVMGEWLTSGIYETEKPLSIEEQDALQVLLREGAKVQDKKDVVAALARLKSFIAGKVYSHSQFIIEEPEQNLYPSAQCALMDYLFRIINHGKAHRLLMTTHSPYVLNYLNLLLRRGEESSSQIKASDLNVFMLSEGRLQNLMMHNEDGSMWAVDTKPHTEVMNDIYEEFMSLRK